VWNTLEQRGNPLASFQGRHKGAVIDFVYPTADSIVSAGRDGLVVVWDIGTAKCIAHSQSHDDAVSCIDSLDDGGLVVSGGLDGKMGIWDKNHMQPIFCERLVPKGAGISFVGSSGSFVAAVGTDNSITVLDIKKLSSPIHRWKEENTNFIYSAKLVDDTILLGTGNGRLVGRSIQSSDMRDEIQCDKNAIRCIESINDGKRIVVATDDGNLIFM